MAKVSPDLEKLVAEVRASPKYAQISVALVRRVAEQELAKGRSLKEAVKTTRSKLHQVGGAYQEGVMDYPAWERELEGLPTDLHDPAALDFCRRMLAHHASTRERLPALEVFYRESLASLEPLSSVLDVACGFNPLALPWMPVLPGVTYYACDIYEDLVAFLNRFFAHFQVNGEAWVCDLVTQPPTQVVQAALLLKTLPCLEQLDKGISTRLLESLWARHLLVSFPARSLGGRSKGMVEFYETQFREIADGQGWKLQRIEINNELVFLVEKTKS